MSEGGSACKKLKVEDDQPHMLVAQLVMLHGIRCGNNMLVFSRSLNKAFLEWSKRCVYEPVFLVVSIASTRIDECIHKAWLRCRVPRLEVLSARPKQWFHVMHVTDEKIPLDHIKEYAVSACTSNIDSVYVQATFVYNGVLDNDLTEKSIFLNRSVKTDHSRHTEEDFRFVVLMKWE
jgi:hypothetical protein